MKGKQKDKGEKIFECGGFGVPSDKFVKDHEKSLEYMKQRWFKAPPYRHTSAEIGGRK